MRGIRFGWAACACGLALCGAEVGAQVPTTTPIIHHTFEEGDSGWLAMSLKGDAPKLSVTHDAANVKEGKGALQFDYKLAKENLTFMLTAIPDGSLAKAKSLRFWVKADHATPIAVILQEKDSGRYVATFTAPKDSWQQVELAPSDFILSDGPNDPKDPDNKLDLDQVTNLAVADFSQIFLQGDDKFAELFGIKPGPHTLFLDDFVVTEDALPPVPSLVTGGVLLDTFAHPQVGWMGIGDVRLSRVTGTPLQGKGLQASYRQAPEKVIGLIRSFTKGKLAGSAKLAFTVVSTKPAKLVVQVEEKSGGKYNATIAVAGGTAPQQISLTFSDFKAAQDSHDTNDHLDLDDVYQLVLIDLTGLTDQADTANTLWLNNIKAIYGH